MFILKWIYSFFIPISVDDFLLPEGEIHGSRSDYKQEIQSKNMDEILQKISKYDILDDVDYDYIKSLPTIKK